MFRRLAARASASRPPAQRYRLPLAASRIGHSGFIDVEGGQAISMRLSTIGLFVPVHFLLSCTFHRFPSGNFVRVFATAEQRRPRAHSAGQRMEALMRKHVLSIAAAAAFLTAAAVPAMAQFYAGPGPGPGGWGPAWWGYGYNACGYPDGGGYPCGGGYYNYSGGPYTGAGNYNAYGGPAWGGPYSDD